MTRVPTTDVAVLVVVLAICTLAVAPAAAATPGDETTDTTLGDTLDGTEESSSSGSDNSTNQSSSASGSGDSNTSSNDSDSTEDSNEKSDDRWHTSSNDSDESNDSGEYNLSSTNRTNESLTDDNLTDTLENETDDVLASIEAASRNETSIIAGLYQSVDDADVDGTTDAVSATTDAVTETTDESTDGLLGAGTLSLWNGGSSAPDGATPAAESGEDAAADGTYADHVTDDADASPSPGAAPAPSPSTGVALGLGAFAIGAAARPDPTLPSTLAGLGSTLAAGLAPVAGRSGVFERLVRLLAPLRYSRYDDSDPLDHEARAEVYEVVDDAPGAYLSEVADRANLPLSTARHHIRVLEREDVVSGAKVRGKRRFYPAYTDGIELAAALNDDATAAVIDAVARFGAASVSDIAADLGRDPSTVSHHLKRLAEDDIIVREREGRAVMNTLSPEARTALDPSRDSTAEEPAEALASD